MKLLRYGPKGQEKPGLLDKDGQIRDLSGVVKDIDGKVLADLSAIPCCLGLATFGCVMASRGASCASG